MSLLFQVPNFFLEKTRIVDHAKRERSYHVFYQMLAGASSALKKELRLEKGVAGFECLRESIIKEGDAQDFEVKTSGQISRTTMGIMLRTTVTCSIYNEWHSSDGWMR